MDTALAPKADAPRRSSVWRAGALVAGATSTSTKLTFALGHLVVAVAVLPIIAMRLPRVRHEPRAGFRV